MLCFGSLAIANPQICDDSKVTIASTPSKDSSDHFIMVPVPRYVGTDTGEVYFIVKSRRKGCARFSECFTWMQSTFAAVGIKR